MSKETGVIVLGIWVFILPFLGIPGSWRTILLALTGAALAILGFLMRGEILSSGVSQRSPRHPFIDSAHAPAPTTPQLHDETNVGEESTS